MADLTVPLYFDWQGSSSSTPTPEMVVQYSYLDEAALGVNGVGDLHIARTFYSYGGPTAYGHGGLNFAAGAFDAAISAAFEADFTYPDSWLELRLFVILHHFHPDPTGDFWDAYAAYLGGPEHLGYPGIIVAQNYYHEESLDAFRFHCSTQMIMSGDTGSDITPYVHAFFPFSLRYVYGDGTEETFEVNVSDATITIGGGPTVEATSTAGNSFIYFDFASPTLKTYLRTAHLSGYPKVLISNAHGQKMRPVYYDLFPTASVDVNGTVPVLRRVNDEYDTVDEVVEVEDLTINFTLFDVWDFEDRFDIFSVSFGDGATLLNQTDLTFSHTYAEGHDYLVQIDLYDVDAPGAYRYNHSLFLTLRPVDSGHPLNALTDPFGQIFIASNTAAGVEPQGVQVFVQRGGGYTTREALYLLTNHKDPSIYQAGGSLVYLGARDLDSGTQKLYVSNDSGETFTFMAEPFGSDPAFKKVRQSGGANGEGLATALVDEVIWFAHSWDNITWDAPVNTEISSTTPGDAHQQAVAGSARLVIMTASGSYVSSTADGAPLPDGSTSWSAF